MAISIQQANGLAVGMERSVGDIVGTRKRYLGMPRKPLTDAREASYWTLSSLLTAECYH